MVFSIFHRVQEENKPDPWAMTDADIVVYDKVFIKQDKDKDGFISIHGQCAPGIEQSLPHATNQFFAFPYF